MRKFFRKIFNAIFGGFFSSIGGQLRKPKSYLVLESDADGKLKNVYRKKERNDV